MKTKKGNLYESWWRVNDSTFRGASYRIRGADTTLLETLEIARKPDGIYYVATVQDQNDRQPVSFRLVGGGSGVWVFENPEHDFPQRIVYNALTGDSLHARIEGMRGGKLSKPEFHYRRVLGLAGQRRTIGKE